MRDTARRLLDMAPPVRKRLLVVVAVLLASTATYVGQGVLIALMLAWIFGGQGVGSILPLLVGALVLLGVRAALLVCRERVAVSASGMVKKALRHQLTDKLFALGPGWCQRTRTGSVQSTVVDGVEAVDPYVGQFLPQAIATVVGAAAITAYIVVLDPLVGGIVLACAAATPLVPLVSERLMKTKMDRWWSSYRRLYADNLDALQGMATLKSSTPVSGAGPLSGAGRTSSARTRSGSCITGGSLSEWSVWPALGAPRSPSRSARCIASTA